MSKKIFSVMMSLIVATSLIGCGSAASKQTATDDASKAETVNSEPAVSGASDENNKEETKWTKNYKLDDLKSLYKEYLGKIEDTTKNLDLKYTKDEKIDGKDKDKITDDCIYFDNKDPEENKIESMYFGMKTYGEDLNSGDLELKLSLKINKDDIIKNGDFDLNKTTISKYVSELTDEKDRNYSDLNKQIIDGLKSAKSEADIKDTVDGLQEEVLVGDDYIIYKLSTKKFVFADADTK